MLKTKAYINLNFCVIIIQDPYCFITFHGSEIYKHAKISYNDRSCCADLSVTVYLNLKAIVFVLVNLQIKESVN